MKPQKQTTDPPELSPTPHSSATRDPEPGPRPFSFGGTYRPCAQQAARFSPHPSAERPLGGKRPSSRGPHSLPADAAPPCCSSPEADLPQGLCTCCFLCHDTHPAPLGPQLLCGTWSSVAVSFSDQAPPCTPHLPPTSSSLSNFSPREALSFLLPPLPLAGELQKGRIPMFCSLQTWHTRWTERVLIEAN